MPSQRKYRLFIDETGNHHYGKASGRYLGLLGVIVPADTYVSEFRPALLDIKRKYINNDPDVPVILHREDIVKRKGLFSCLVDQEHRRKFNHEIVNFFKTQNFTLISVVIDKLSHLQCFGDAAKHPYHYCAEALLERFYFFLREQDGFGDVVAESRGNAQDKQLRRAWKDFCECGTFYVQRKELARRLFVKEMQFKTKTDNVFGLQVADLLVKACTREVLINYEHTSRHKENFNRYVASAVAQKYRLGPNGSAIGRGMKLLHAQKNRPH